jgi:hypothetical protein
MTSRTNWRYYYNWGKSSLYDFTDIEYGTTAADSGRTYKIDTLNVQNVSSSGGISKTYFYVKVWALDTVTGCGGATSSATVIPLTDTIYRVNCNTTLPPEGKDLVNSDNQSLGGNSVFISCSYETSRNTIVFNLLNTSGMQSAHKGIENLGLEYFDGIDWTESIPSIPSIPSIVSDIEIETIPTDTLRLTLTFDVESASESSYAEKIQAFRAYYTVEGSEKKYYSDSARFYVNSVMTKSIEVSLNPSDTTVCDGSSVFLTASADKENPRYSIAYLIRDTVNIVSSTSTHTMVASKTPPVKHYVSDVIQSDNIVAGSTTRSCYDTVRSGYAIVRTGFNDITSAAITDSISCGGTVELRYDTASSGVSSWLWQFSATNTWTADNFETLAGSDNAVRIFPSRSLGYYRVVTVKYCESAGSTTSFNVTSISECCPYLWRYDRFEQW